MVICIPSGIALIGVGATVEANARQWYVAGGWVVGLSLLLLFTWGVIWPALVWFTGPLQDRLARSGPKGLEVLSASYHGVNVTWNLNQRVLDDQLSLLVMPGPIGVEDPAPGVPKTLDVKYRVKGKEHLVTVQDGVELTLP